MKTSLLALFFTLSVNICMAQDDFFVGAWLQANDLMYDSSYGYSNIEYNATPWEIRPIDSVLKQGYKTSRINVLKEFGVDFYWMASPSPWNISSVNANRKVFKLFFNHGVKVIGDIDYWFNPIPINGEYINTIGYIDFNGAPDNANWNTNKLGRPNYNEIIPQITYNPAVFGFMLGGELAYRSGHYYNISGNRVDWGNREALCQTSEISPTHLYDAINLVKELSSKKIFLQVGTHTAVINDNTDDFRFWSKHIDGDTISCGNRVYQFIEDTLDVNPQDHFQVPEKYPDYLIEGSYFELNLEPDWTFNGFSYPMNCFRYKYKNLLKSGTGIDGYPLNYNSTFSCPIYKERDGFNDTAINGDNRHYLSKFRNIDYFRNKGIDVISEFSSFQTKFVSEYDSTNPSSKYWGHYKRDMGNWNSTSFVNNANYFWFNAYNSIVHGVVGILPYIEYLKLFTNPCHEMLLLKDVANINLEEFQYRVFYEDSEFFQNKDIKQGSIVFDCDANYDSLILPKEMDYYRGLVFKALQKLVFSTRGEFNQSNPNATWQDGRKTRFDYDFWSPAFKDFIGPLYNEISLLKRMGFLNIGSLIHRRIDHPDEQCLLLPHDSLYIKKCENQSMGIPNKYIDVIEDYYQKNENNNTYSGPTKFNEFRNENYGLRYILLSNQDRVNEEYILIVSNQLNLPLLDVPLNISHFPVLRDMSEAQLLFSTSQKVVDPAGNLNSNYKSQRNLNFSWEESTLDEIPSVFIPINNKTFNLDFGPLDVHIIRFKRSVCSTPPLRKVWSDLNTGRIGGHSLNQNDKPLVIGNFYGDESDEVLIVRHVPDNNSWATTQIFKDGNFTNAFNNAGNGWLNRQQLGWWIGNDDVFIAGNFIENTSGDELICIRDPQTQVVNRGAAMLGFKDEVADWDYWFWSNFSDETKIGSWTLTANSKYFVGNFDNDFLDEVLFVRYDNSSKIVEIKIQKYNHQSGTWNQLLSLYNPNLGSNMKITVGDFINSDGKDDIFITNGYNARLFKIQGQSLIEVWNNNNSLGNLGSTVRPSWNLNSTDIVTSGKFYNPINRSDNLLLIRNPSFNNSNSNASAEIVYYNSWTNKWYSSWSNYACCNSLLDWKIIDNDYTKIEYNPIRIINGTNQEKAELNTHLLAIRGIESITPNCCYNNMNANMYTFSNINNAKSDLNLDNPIIEGNNNPEIHFIIIPNPTKTGITIQGNHSELIDEVEVWDIFGKKLICKSQKSQIVYLDFTDYNKGMYIIKVFSNGKVYINKILKE